MASRRLDAEEEEHAVNEHKDCGDKGFGIPCEPVEQNEYDYELNLDNLL